MVPETAPDDGRIAEETEVLVMLLLVRTLLLLMLTLLWPLLLLADVIEFPNGAGNPLAGDCRICTGGRTVVGALAVTDDDEVLLVALSDEVWFMLAFIDTEPSVWLMSFF